MLSPEEVEQRKKELEERRELKRRYRKRQFIMYTIMIVIGIVLMIVAARFSYQRATQTSLYGQTSTINHHRLNILFIGTDQVSASGSRADTIMLVSLDLKAGQAGIISIPRDTRVWIPTR